MCSVSQIEVPGPNGSLHITSQQEVEQHLCEALALCFQLTAHSPCLLVEPLYYELGLLGTSPAAQAILHGTYHCPAEVDLYTPQLIAILQIPPRSSAVPLGINQDDFISQWRCSQKWTSSSYSGLHHGHYKASVDCPWIAEFHTLITEMAFKHGYSLSHLAIQPSSALGEEDQSYLYYQSSCPGVVGSQFQYCNENTGWSPYGLPGLAR